MYLTLATVTAGKCPSASCPLSGLGGDVPMLCYGTNTQVWCGAVPVLCLCLLQADVQHEHQPLLSPSLLLLPPSVPGTLSPVYA